MCDIYQFQIQIWNKLVRRLNYNSFWKMISSDYIKCTTRTEFALNIFLAVTLVIVSLLYQAPVGNFLINITIKVCMRVCVRPSVFVRENFVAKMRENRFLFDLQKCKASWYLRLMSKAYHFCCWKCVLVSIEWNMFFEKRSNRMGMRKVSLQQVFTFILFLFRPTYKNIYFMPRYLLFSVEG